MLHKTSEIRIIRPIKEIRIIIKIYSVQQPIEAPVQQPIEAPIQAPAEAPTEAPTTAAPETTARSEEQERFDNILDFQNLFQ